jgi:aminoglycoside phosphotransferase (APT) family kinase protein
MPDLLDRVQPGLPDAAKLRDFITRQCPDVDRVEIDGPVPMFGGWNSAMASFTACLDGLERRLVVRGALPPEKQVAVNDLDHEWAVLELLAASDELVAPSPWLFDPSGMDLGIPAMLVEFVEGTPLQAAAFVADTDALRELAHELARLAARIHAVPIDKSAQSLATPADWSSYIDTQIDTLVKVESDWIEPDPMMRFLAAWLDASRPSPTELTLVHGDFHTSNTMVLPSGRQLAVDWQFTHVGDPREDLGWTMIYESIAPPHLVTAHQAEFCTAYREVSGLSDEVINPHTLKWFALLAIARVLAATVPAAQAYVAGTNTSMTLAAGLALGVFPHRFCLDLIREMEAR